MSFAARFGVPTGFGTVGMATAFAVNARQASIGVWVWAMSNSGVITRTNTGFGNVITDTFSSSWGLPAVADGANWEASIQITSGSITRTGSVNGTLTLLDLDSDGSGGVSFGIGTITPQTTPWFSLDVARRVIDAAVQFSGGASSTIAMAGTLFIRQKSSLQQISQSLSVNLTSAT